MVVKFGVKNLYIIFIVLPSVLILSCVNKKDREANKLSEKMVKIHHNFSLNEHIDKDFVSYCANFNDPWVRSNCAGMLRSIGYKCDEREISYVVKLLKKLAFDADVHYSVQTAARNSLETIASGRKNYRIREGIVYEEEKSKKEKYADICNVIWREPNFLFSKNVEEFESKSFLNNQLNEQFINKYVTSKNVEVKFNTTLGLGYIGLNCQKRSELYFVTKSLRTLADDNNEEVAEAAVDSMSWIILDR